MCWSPNIRHFTTEHLGLSTEWDPGPSFYHFDDGQSIFFFISLTSHIKVVSVNTDLYNKEYHFYICTFKEPGTGLICSLSYLQQPYKLFASLLYNGGIWGFDRISNLPKDLQIVNGRLNGIHTEALWLHSPEIFLCCGWCMFLKHIALTPILAVLPVGFTVCLGNTYIYI